MRPQCWSRAWKTGHCLRRLSGLTLRPSAAQGGVGRWISSLRDSRASRGAAPASKRAPRTTDGSGPTSRALLARWSPESFSWKTSQGSLLGGSVPFLDRWPRSGSTRSGECFERPMSAHRTGERDSSSWPTATATDSRSSGKAGYTSVKTHAGTTLTDAIRMWSTPTATVEGRGNCPSQLARRSPGLKVEAEHFHQGQTTTKDGAQLYPRLNPRFVEWLMGLPTGWVSLEPVAMESFRQWWRLHLSLLQEGQWNEPQKTEA